MVVGSFFARSKTSDGLSFSFIVGLSFTLQGGQLHLTHMCLLLYSIHKGLVINTCGEVISTGPLNYCGDHRSCNQLDTFVALVLVSR